KRIESEHGVPFLLSAARAFVAVVLCSTRVSARGVPRGSMRRASPAAKSRGEMAGGARHTPSILFFVGAPRRFGTHPPPGVVPPMTCRPRLLLLGLALLPSLGPAQKPVEPGKAEATFKVLPGLEIRLWASEPLFVNPTCMDIDHQGRVWVCESVNYRNKLHRRPKLHRAEGDRIVILEDTTGTGKP